MRVYDKHLSKEVPYTQGKGWSVPVGVTRARNEFKYHDFEMVPQGIERVISSIQLFVVLFKLNQSIQTFT